MVWFLPGHVDFSTDILSFASTLDRQRSYANAPEPIKDYFRKLRDVFVCYTIKAENMWNMDEKGSTLGTAKCAKVIARTGRCPLRATHGGPHELITVIECWGTGQRRLTPMVAFKGTKDTLPTA